MTTSEQTGIKIDFNDALLSHLASSSINFLGYTPTMDAKSLQTPIYSAISIKEIRTYKRLKKMTLHCDKLEALFTAFICFLDFITNVNICYYEKFVLLIECKTNQRIIKYLSLATFLRAYLHDEWKVQLKALSRILRMKMWLHNVWQVLDIKSSLLLDRDVN